MELFYTGCTEGAVCMLDPEQSRHCIKVLRHKAGDTVQVIDGRGNLLSCRIREIEKEVVLDILSKEENFGSHPYILEMAVAPTKNTDRYEWFLEKATELGVDRIIPVIGRHSERRVIKTERLQKILVSAAKQSLKGTVPVLEEAVGIKDFLEKADVNVPGKASGTLKLIAYCGQEEKISLPGALRQWQTGFFAAPLVKDDSGKRFRSTEGPDNETAQVLLSEENERKGDCTGENGTNGKDRKGPERNEPESEAVLPEGPAPEPAVNKAGKPRIIILIGPEGDFSPSEVACALSKGYRPIHLGASRLRTETAAVAAVAGVYFYFYTL